MDVDARVTLDRFDRAILEALQENADRPVVDIAESIGLSPPACYRRIRRLEVARVIERRIAVVRPRTLGWPISMVVMVALEREDARTMRELRTALLAAPEVVEAWNVTGEHDLVVRVVARDMESYEEMAHRLFASNERVRSFQTLVVLREMKQLSPVPAS